MRIVVSGGGTAGHVSPVLATVDALRARNKRVEILYIGRPSGMEADLVRAAKLRFVGVQGGKYRRVPHAHWWQKLADIPSLIWNLRDVVLIGIGFVQCVWVMGRFRPAAVFNKGGVVGLPVGLACRFLGVPMVIHEPDIVPGLGNKILSRWAQAIAVGFPGELYGLWPVSKIRYTGNPVQPAILGADARQAAARFNLDPGRPVVLVAGGSQGAEAVNKSLLKILPDLIASTQVIHLAGKLHYRSVQQASAKMGISAQQGYHVEPFLRVEEMAQAYAQATLVVARAGASTIAELAALGKPAILVPNRLAAAHQIANAEWVAKNQAAELVADDQPQQLLQAIQDLLGSSTLRRQLTLKISQINPADAAERLADVVLEAAGGRG